MGLTQDLLVWVEVEAQTESFGLHPSGADAPKIDRQLPGDRDDGLFARGGVSGGSAQDRDPAGDGSILRLVANQSPSRLDERMA